MKKLVYLKYIIFMIVFASCDNSNSDIEPKDYELTATYRIGIEALEENVLRGDVPALKELLQDFKTNLAETNHQIMQDDNIFQVVGYGSSEKKATADADEQAANIYKNYEKRLSDGVQELMRKFNLKREELANGIAQEEGSFVKLTVSSYLYRYPRAGEDPINNIIRVSFPIELKAIGGSDY